MKDYNVMDHCVRRYYQRVKGGSKETTFTKQKREQLIFEILNEIKLGTKISTETYRGKEATKIAYKNHIYIVGNDENKVYTMHKSFSNKSKMLIAAVATEHPSYVAKPPTKKPKKKKKPNNQRR